MCDTFVWWLLNLPININRPLEEGGSLGGLFLGLSWWSGWKLDETHLFGQNWTRKSQNWPKSIICEPLVVESGWPLKMTVRLDLL